MQRQEQGNLQERRDLWEVRLRYPLSISSGVLFVLDLAFLPNLTQSHTLTTWETTALTSFVIALPCLASNAFIVGQMIIERKVLVGSQWLFFAIQLTGYAASIAGIASMIANVNESVAIIFIILCALLLIFCSALNKDIKGK